VTLDVPLQGSVLRLRRNARGFGLEEAVLGLARCRVPRHFAHLVVVEIEVKLGFAGGGFDLRAAMT
jgi:hypothetical protein